MILPQTETWHQHDPLLPFPLCVPSFVSSDSGSQGVPGILYLCLCICICWRRESLPAVLSFDPGSHGVSGRAALHSVTSELSFRDPSLLLALHINWEHQDMIQGLQPVNPSHFSENKIVSCLSSSPSSASNGTCCQPVVIGSGRAEALDTALFQKWNQEYHTTQTIWKGRQSTEVQNLGVTLM